MTLERFAHFALFAGRRFFAWWLGELAACVPASLRIGRGWGRDARVLMLGPHEAIVGLDRGGRFELLERLSLAGRQVRAAGRDRGQRVRLRLTGDEALRVTIPLPPAALENLTQAVAFQLDRFTPFAPEQVYLACRPGAREGDTIPVATTVVERQSVAEAVTAAERLGFTVTAIEIGGTGDLGPDLLSVPELRRHSLGQTALTAASIALLVALAATAVVLPMSREEGRAAALSARIAAARVKAEAAQRIAKAIDAEQREAGFLADRKRNQPSAIAVLLELTRLAPDDTWLRSATFSSSAVQIDGVSPSASGLIARFETSELFHQAEFRSPVTPDAATGREHFVISAQVGTRSAR